MFFAKSFEKILRENLRIVSQKGLSCKIFVFKLKVIRLNFFYCDQ